MAAELPGFYYDTERKRYFPLGGAGRRTESQALFKKQKVEQLDTNDKLKNILCAKEYEVYLRKLHDPLQRVQMGNSRKNTETLRMMKLNNLPSQEIQSPLSRKQKIKKFHFLSIDETIIENKALIINETALLLTNRGRVFSYKYHESSAVPNFVYTIPNEKQYLVGCKSFMNTDTGVYIHFTYLHDSSSVFLLLKNIDPSENLTSTFNLPKNGGFRNTINVSVNIGLFCILVSGNSFFIYSWETKKLSNKKTITIQNNSQSDILSISTYQIDKSHTRIYFGCRNGNILTRVLNHDNILQDISKEFHLFRIQNIRSIVSLHAGRSDGIVFVSALSEKEYRDDSPYYNTVLMIDLLRYNEKSKNIKREDLILFQTKLQNLTDGSELFTKSDDDRFIIYGTENNVSAHNNSLELFSTYASDNILSIELRGEKQQNIASNISYLPLRSFEELKKNTDVLGFTKVALLEHDYILLVNIKPSKNDTSSMYHLTNCVIFNLLDIS